MYKTTGQQVKKILQESGIKRKQRKRCLKSNEKQKKRQKTCLNKLRKGLFKATNNLIIIMDDESYFTIDGSDTNHNDHFYQHPSISVPDNVKYRETSKFPEKVLVWIAISRKGMSQAFIFKSGNNVSAKVYKKNCLPKLKKFIQTFHSRCKYIFWPDLASSHYAKDTLKWLEQNKIKCQPAKCPAIETN